ncbi:hypothetical protein PsYK624_109300 [Phanerochaete sordida]|uniref:Uncharacterized protein n=1 Tax=Phanerochaete sordida TaxID=48140 RepID=A0A9P3GEU5_9APHY|nr:hypothetical protein PsYK624_109300 [Phanerochaete sordida]
MATAVQTIRAPSPRLPASASNNSAPSFETAPAYVRDAFALSFAIAKCMIVRCETSLFANSKTIRPTNPEYFMTGDAKKEEFGLYAMKRVLEPISEFLLLLRRDARLYELAISSVSNFFRVLGFIMRALPVAQFAEQAVLPYWCWYSTSRCSQSYLSVTGAIDAHARLLENDL